MCAFKCSLLVLVGLVAVPRRADAQLFGFQNSRDDHPTNTQLQFAPAAQPLVGCSAAMICVKEQYCTMLGIISETPVALSPEQMLRRMPLVNCRNRDTGVVGKCCRDPNYVDPWPAGNLPADYSGGFDEQGFPTFLNISKTRPKKPIQPVQQPIRPLRPQPQQPAQTFPQIQPQPTFQFNKVISQQPYTIGQVQPQQPKQAAFQPLQPKQPAFQATTFKPQKLQVLAPTFPQIQPQPDQPDKTFPRVQPQPAFQFNKVTSLQPNTIGQAQQIQKVVSQQSKQSAFQPQQPKQPSFLNQHANQPFFQSQQPKQPVFQSQQPKQLAYQLQQPKQSAFQATTLKPQQPTLFQPQQSQQLGTTFSQIQPKPQQPAKTFPQSQPQPAFQFNNVKPQQPNIIGQVQQTQNVVSLQSRQPAFQPLQPQQTAFQAAAFKPQQPAPFLPQQSQLLAKTFPQIKSQPEQPAKTFPQVQPKPTFQFNKVVPQKSNTFYRVQQLQAVIPQRPKQPAFESQQPAFQLQQPKQPAFHPQEQTKKLEIFQDFPNNLPSVSFPSIPGFEKGHESLLTIKSPVIAHHTPGAQCGIINQVQHPGRLGAVDTAFGEIPWMAMVLKNSEKKLLCSGAIVAPNLVITAANCVYGLNPSDVSIKAGEWKLGYELKHEEPLPFEIVQVKNIVAHPSYVDGAAGFDIAMLFLQSSIRLNQHIDTICIGDASVVSPQRKCISTGWGKTILQVHAAGALMHKIDVDVLSNDQCRQRLQGAESAIDIDDSLVCAKAHKQNNNMCQVDVGGPLACDRGDGNFELVGVYSQDTGCLPINQVATFTLIDSHWVNSMIDGSPVPQPEDVIPSGPAPFEYRPVQQLEELPSRFHYHIPGVPCDCDSQQESRPEGYNQYLPPV